MFDSYEGLPSLDEEKDLPCYKKGWMRGDFQDVSEFLAGLGMSGYELVRGWFCDTFPEFVRQGRKICFLHVDCDLYESTKQCLVHLHELMVPGGVMVFDDYFDLGGGEKKAVDELVAVTGERVFAGPMEQVFIVKGRVGLPDDEVFLIDPFGDGGVKVSLRYLADNGPYLKDLAQESFRREMLAVRSHDLTRLRKRIDQVSGYHARVLARLKPDVIEAQSVEGKRRDSVRCLPDGCRIGEPSKNVVNPGTVNPSGQSYGRGLAANVNVG